MSELTFTEMSAPTPDMLDFTVERQLEWHEAAGKLVPEWYDAMWQALDGSDFGTYCHEGGSLFADAAKILGKEDWTYQDENIYLIQDLASTLTFICEESICPACASHGEENEKNAQEFVETMRGEMQ